jgi:hypothetical protein
MKNYVYDALKILIELSRDAQDKHTHQAYVSVKEWAKEYCTIHVGSARQTGHTEAVRRLIFEDGMNIGYLSFSHHIFNDFKNTYNERRQHSKLDDCGNLEFCGSYNNDIPNLIQGRDFSNLDAIVFDNSSFLSQKKKDKIYNEIMASLLPALYGCGQKREKPLFIIFLQ